MHIPNVFIFQMVMLGHLWHVVVCYFVLHNASALGRFLAAIGQNPWGADILVSREFNTYLEGPDVQECDETIAAAMLMDGL